MVVGKHLAAVLIWSMATVCAASPATAREIVVTAVGDIMLSGSGSSVFKRHGYDYPFAATAAEIRRGDIAIANLEAPIARRGTEFTDKRFRFRTDPKSAAALRRAGFTVVTLANNHIMDFGITALNDTIRELDRMGIAHAGAGDSLEAARQEAVVTVGEKRIAILAYSLTLPAEFYATPENPGTAPGYPAYYRQDIARARDTVDYVIVSFHWGSERATVPHPHQVATARDAIDAGADVVIGHHPHVLQGIERYRRGIILYSLGNFAFGTMSRTSDRSAIARITLDDGVKGVELVPLNVLNRDVRFQPRVLEGKEGEEVIDHLNRLSADFGTVIMRERGSYRVEMGRERQQLSQK